MDLQRCINGHFYDADAFAFCPHCPSEGAQMNNGYMNNFGDVQTESIDFSNNVTMEDDSAIDKTVKLTDLIDEVKDNAADDEQVVTVGYYQSAVGSEPVVGWLVCIEGNHFGEDFKLRAGKNFIGRASNMDVCLSGDSSVSREKHTIIVFEPKESLFIVQPGDSKELSYLNGQVVLTPAQIQAHDVISVGNTKLMFIPFCSDKFKWQDAKAEN